jgi:hypothetical protein
MRHRPRLAAKIEGLITDIRQHPVSGLGKPEALRNSGKKVWSRRIDKKTVWSIMWRAKRSHYSAAESITTTIERGCELLKRTHPSKGEGSTVLVLREALFAFHPVFRNILGQV